MVFSSLLFCTLFLPLCLLAYYGLPRLLSVGRRDKIRLSNYILLIASLIFYAFGGVKYLLLIAFVIFINWCGGFLCCPRRHTDVGRKWGLVAIVAADLGLLFFFKYFNLCIAMIENVFFPEGKTFAERAFGFFTGTGTGALGLAQIVLPVGISFFTFQALSYVIDVYKGTVDIQDNLLYFALYIVCFPQLIAGPIVHYKDVEDQINNRTVSSARFSQGISRFCYGLAKKVLIANTLAVVVDNIWKQDISSLDATVTWLGAICYTFEIYYDFSGYSDMAIGLGHMFGFEFKENFNYPYWATSVQDFWRRWHISLSTWFRDYVYIPLGGSRCSMKRTCYNIFIVFLLTGIWHGANMTFLVWGLVYGLLLIAERLWLGDFLKKIPFKWINRLIVFVVVSLLWVVFRADNIVLAGIYIGHMFTGGIKIISLLSYLSGKTIIALLLAIFFAGFAQNHFPVKKLQKFKAIPLFLLFVSLLFLVNNTYNPFIYFQF